mmetsp:Transcript_37290/g.105219  ORF Transcript_37290/g.105219 Transcript_37290/m.105219 type:complete len:250 (+) Transcript_37290:684-1433(+)
MMQKEDVGGVQAAPVGSECWPWCSTARPGPGRRTLPQRRGCLRQEGPEAPPKNCQSIYQERPFPTQILKQCPPGSWEALTTSRHSAREGCPHFPCRQLPSRPSLPRPSEGPRCHLSPPPPLPQPTMLSAPGLSTCPPSGMPTAGRPHLGRKTLREAPASLLPSPSSGQLQAPSVGLPCQHGRLSLAYASSRIKYVQAWPRLEPAAPRTHWKRLVQGEQLGLPQQPSVPPEVADHPSSWGTALWALAAGG